MSSGMIRGMISAQECGGSPTRKLGTRYGVVLCEQRQENSSPWLRLILNKPDLMVRRPDYLGPLRHCSLMVEQLATVHPRPATLGTPGIRRPTFRSRGRSRASMTMTAVPQTRTVTAPTDARPPGRLSTHREPDVIEPLKRLSDILTFTELENRYDGECWRCSQPVAARAGTLVNDQEQWRLLCSRCARLAAAIRGQSTRRRVNPQVRVPKRG